MQRPTFIAIATAFLLAMSPLSFATINGNLDANAIRQQQQQIRADAEAGKGRYQDMDANKRAELYAHQAKVAGLIEGVEVTTDLTEAKQIELFNSLESIEAILNAAEDERMVCERHKPTGSNMPRTICKTVAERRVDREASQRDMGQRNLECSEAMMGPGGCK